MSRSLAGRWLAAVAGTLAIWWAVATLAVPWLIKRGHAGAIPLADRLMGGRASTPVEEYLATWAASVPAISFVLLSAMGLATLAGIVVHLGSGDPATPAQDRDTASTDVSEVPGLLSFTAVVATACWFGLMTGLGESYYLGGRAFWLGLVVPNLRHVSQDSLWMVPLVDTVFFGLVGTAIALIGRWVSTFRSPGIVYGVPLFACALSWLMVTERVAVWAALLLAAGLAARVAARISRARPRFIAFARQSSPWLVGLWVVVFLGVVAVPPIREARETGELADPVRPGRSIILIVLDTQRAASTSVYESPRRTTPNLELISGSSAVFDRAIAPAAWTLPTHATMFTGLPNSVLETESFQPLDDRFVTVAEVLRDEGYSTAGFVANIKFGSDFYGLDQGFVHYADQPRSIAMAVESAWLSRTVITRAREAAGNHGLLVRKRAGDVNRDFLGWLDRRRQPQDRPFFVFLNYFDAHHPYQPPAPYDTAFSDVPPLHYRGPRGFPDLAQWELDELEVAYESSILYLDHEIGVLYKELERRGLLDVTSLIITSDHGESFGDHESIEHGNTLYMPQTHVPLLVRPAGGTIPTRLDFPIGLGDIASTILDLAGSDPQQMPGRSLMQFVGPDVVTAPPAEPIASKMRGWESVFIGDHHYLRGPDGEEEVYVHSEDPWELDDVGAQIDPALMARFRQALGRDRPSSSPPAPPSPGG